MKLPAIGPRIVAVILVMAAAFPASAQQSAAYSLEEHALNGGATPAGGSVLASASFRMIPGAVGDPVTGLALASSSFRLDLGNTFAYRPTGEVLGLGFLDGTTLAWTSHEAAGAYNLYRQLVSQLALGGSGSCFRSALQQESTLDLEHPPADDGFFYLVTVTNRLDEEGTKGWTSAGVERGNLMACP